MGAGGGNGPGANALTGRGGSPMKSDVPSTFPSVNANNAINAINPRRERQCHEKIRP